VVAETASCMQVFKVQLRSYLQVSKIQNAKNIAKQSKGRRNDHDSSLLLLLNPMAHNLAYSMFRLIVPFFHLSVFIVPYFHIITERRKQIKSGSSAHSIAIQ
jgi:hypothetical protein